ncbi:MAG: hypothetical protein JNL58_05190 [Planctomyces sp.]|nr:hypothetical protein [Planctomyces sp.]
MKTRISLRSLFSAGLLAGSCLSACAEDDSLFSEIRGKSVFSNSSESTGTNGDTVNPVESRILSIDRLAELVREGGFEATSTDQKAVSTTKSLPPWNFPVQLKLSEDEQTVLISLGLATVSTAKDMTADKLLDLLELNEQISSADFTWNRERRRTEILGRLENRGLNGTSLRDEINRLAILAKEHELVWKAADSGSSQGTVTPGTTVQQGNSTAPLPKTTSIADSSNKALIGRWSASRSSTEAFAVEFKADGKFSLVFLKAGKQTRSDGSYTLDSKNLTLTGADGSPLSGSFQQKSATEFLFSPGSEKNTAAQPLTFRKAQS